MTQVAIQTSDLQKNKERKTQLIQQCKDAVGNDLDGRRPLHIAVIGPPGCGKSSFLNTTFASFKNNDGACWKETAKTGNYGEQDIQVTSRLRIYPKKVYIEDSKNLALMPTFLDVTGFEDEETEINKEMLSLLFNGKFKGGEDLHSVRQFYINNGRDIHTLRQFYNKRSENTKVDRIIVVCTANRTPPLPKSLLKAIRDTAKGGNREIPVYGVLTHADEQNVIDPDYLDHQKLFKDHLGLIYTRFKCIENYCTDVDPHCSYISTTFPRLDIPVLELMTQVLCHHLDDTIVPGDTITPEEPISWKKIAFVIFIIILLPILLMTIYSIANRRF